MGKQRSWMLGLSPTWRLEIAMAGRTQATKRPGTSFLRWVMIRFDALVDDRRRVSSSAT